MIARGVGTGLVSLSAALATSACTPSAPVEAAEPMAVGSASSSGPPSTPTDPWAGWVQAPADPGNKVLELRIESTFEIVAGCSPSTALSGHIPQMAATDFTAYDSGFVVYRSEGTMHAAHAGRDAVAALHRRVLDAGFARITGKEQQCSPGTGGVTLCINTSDAEWTLVGARLPSGQWHVIESYDGLSDDPVALGGIVTSLTEWRAPEARPYLADAGTVWVERCPDVSTDARPPPRDADWLDAPAAERSWTRRLDEEAVRALAPDVLPLQGRAYADAKGALVVHWIPSLPDEGEGPDARRRPR